MRPVTALRAVPPKSASSNDLVAATNALADIYGDEACGEALARALVSERTQKREDARFWVDVCNRLFEQERSNDRSA